MPTFMTIIDIQVTITMNACFTRYKMPQEKQTEYDTVLVHL